MRPLAQIISQQFRRIPEPIKVRVEEVFHDLKYAVPFIPSTAYDSFRRGLKRLGEVDHSQDSKAVYRDLSFAIVPIGTATERNQNNPDYPFHEGLIYEEMSEVSRDQGFEGVSRYVNLGEAIDRYHEAYERGKRINPPDGYAKYEIALAKAYFQLGIEFGKEEFSEDRGAQIKWDIFVKEKRTGITSLGEEFNFNPHHMFQQAYEHLHHAINLLEKNKQYVSPDLLQMKESVLDKL